MAKTKKATNSALEILDTSIEVGYEYTLENIMADLKEKGYTISLRKIAQHLDINYNMLLKAGRRAEAGKVFNPDVINFNAAEDYIRSKIGGPEEFDAIDWETIAKESQTAARATSRATIDNFVTGTLLKLRKNDQLYKVNFRNEECIVIIPMQNAEEFAMEGKARVFSHDTFLHQGPKREA